MNYQINCSYGEIMDQLSILEIKLKKGNIVNKDTLTKEYNKLKQYKKPNINNLYDNLITINGKIWIFNDIMKKINENDNMDMNRQLNTYKEYYNLLQQRRTIKYEITKLENDISNITYMLNNNFDDHKMLQEAMILHNEKKIIESNNILNKLCKKYKDDDSINDFIMQLFFALQTSNDLLGKEYPYLDKLTKYIRSKYFNNHNSEEMKDAYHLSYGSALLEKKQYDVPLHYIRNLQKVTANGPGLDIRPETMSYFNINDTNKTLLIYMAGGFGDKIMFPRFIPLICEQNPENKIIFMVDDCLSWIYEDLFKDINNITIIKESHKGMIGSFMKFDYHTNITFLFHHLKLSYADIYIDYWDTTRMVSKSNFNLETILDTKKKNIVINWHGNYLNAHEYIRGMKLEKLIPLFEKFKNKNINWISVQKTFSKEEGEILKKYNVHNVGSIIDNDGDSFKDTIKIFKNIDLVISTDTSLVHLAGHMDVPCWCLLYIGCEWRWTRRDISTKWYPKIKLIRQIEFNCWDNVIVKVINELENSE